jgi:hypothetical protein
MRLIVVRGIDVSKEWPVHRGSSTVIGRGHRDGSIVDLAPDRRISRVHARVWEDSGQWWLEDLGSKNGTRLCGQEIAGVGPVPLDPGIPIKVGYTTLILAPENWRRVMAGNVSVEFRFAGAIGLSLAHSGLGPVTGMVARNDSQDVAEETEVGFSIAGYGSSDSVTIPSLRPGQAVLIGSPQFHWATAVLEGQVEGTRTCMYVSVRGQTVPNECLELRVLAHNEWSSLVEHRDSLASFVLPNHPVITRLTHQIRQNRGLCGMTKGRDLVAAVYGFLAEQCSLVYTAEAPSFERECQKLRLPHQVMPVAGDWGGEGTCVDLALLAAGCLENLGDEAVIVLVDLGSCWHALVGTKGPWYVGHVASDPPVDNLIDPTGFSLRDGGKLTLQEARERAVEMVLSHRIACTIDVPSCRDRGLLPLPFAGEPNLSGRVVLAIDLARNLATKRQRSKTGASHLFLAMLAFKDGVTARTFTHLGVQLEQIAGLQDGCGALAEMPDMGESYHFDMALAGAKELAKRCGSPSVDEEHLLVALMELRSKAVSDLLRVIGSAPDQVLMVLSKLYPEVVSNATDWLAASEELGSRGSRPRM